MENERSYFLRNTWKYDIFCIVGKDGISFFHKYGITLPIKNKYHLLPKILYHGNIIFSGYL